MTGTKPPVIRVGTRASELAVIQTGLVVSMLRKAHPNIEFEIVRISTAGDRDKRSALETIGVSIFVKELEAALEDGRADIAIHSLKDMPSKLPEGFILAALPKRGDPRDVLVSRFEGGVANLPSGARIGTSSPRRVAQLRAARGDLEIIRIRGNVDTRITKALGGDETGYDGAILAAAGLDRMGRMREVSEALDLDNFIPASGQGTLAVETMASNTILTELISAIDHPTTRAVSIAERAYLARLGAGCATAASAFATLDGDSMTIRGFAASLDGDRSMTRTSSGDITDASELGNALAEDMIKNGALELIHA